MTFEIKKFVKSVVDSGIATASELAVYERRLINNKDGIDARDLVRELLQDRRLTSFQARALLTGASKRLVLGSYLILDKLGAGGMGQVYKAIHRRMKRVVAIKVLPPTKMNSPDTMLRFQREAEAAAKLNHPNIVTAHDAAEDKGLHYLVMEYINGVDLSSIVESGCHVPLAFTLDWTLDVARGLHYAHQRRVIHRDIKPANLLLSADGSVKILDMGLARLEDSPGDAEETSAAGLTRMGEIIGTIDFMSPEQAEDTRQAGAAADIYSLGCTLFYLVTRQFMFPHDTVMRKLIAHRENPPPSMLQVCPKVPAELDVVYQKMVAKKPSDRQSNMGDVVRELAAVRKHIDNDDTVAVVTIINKVRKSLTTKPAGSTRKTARQAETIEHTNTEPPAPQDNVQSSTHKEEPTVDKSATRKHVPETTVTQHPDALEKTNKAENFEKKKSSHSFSIVIACQCSTIFAAPGSLCGSVVECPACGDELVIPSPADSMVSPNHSEVDCSCGHHYFAVDGAIGRTIKCMKCRQPLTVPKQTQIEVACDDCGQRFAATNALAGLTVRCTACGGRIVVPMLT
ncbi:MAG: serine/threonine protein kinase [Pirellulaceae bacterium]|nr:serine/threonine protein kinase [Pirellulaceae bacterium]